MAGITSERTIKVGVIEQVVDTKKTPYFESFLSFQHASGQEANTIPEHDDIPFFDVINYGVKHGYRHFFRRMPDQFSDYQVLCETLEFLVVDILGKSNLSGILSELRSGKSDWDPDERRTIEGAKAAARDAAFKLLYLFVLGEFDSAGKDSNMAYNTALFVVSHRRIFKCRTRKMVRKAYEERFEITAKQEKELSKWPINEPEGDKWREDEATTEAEDFYYDSDSSF